MSEAIEKLRKQLADTKEKLGKPRAGAVGWGPNGPIGIDVAMMLFDAIESQAKEIEELKASTVLYTKCGECKGTGQSSPKTEDGVTNISTSHCEKCGGTGVLLTSHGLKFNSFLTKSHMPSM